MASDLVVLGGRAPAPEVRELTREQGRALLNRQARRYLDISGEEFLRRLDAGEYRGTEDPDVMHPSRTCCTSPSSWERSLGPSTAMTGRQS